MIFLLRRPLRPTPVRHLRHPLTFRADFAADGAVIGLELTDPARATLKEINDVLARLGLAGVSPEEVRPLQTSVCSVCSVVDSQFRPLDLTERVDATHADATLRASSPSSAPVL